MAIIPIYILSGQSNAAFLGVDSALQHELEGKHGFSFELVKFAVPGTSLAQNNADRGDWSVHSDGELYDQLLAAVQERIDYVISQGHTPLISSVFWVQGEADASRLETAEAYVQNLMEFIKQLRTDLDTDMQFVIAGLSSQSQTRYDDIVRDAQHFVSDHVSDVSYVNTDSLSYLPDNLHYNIFSRIELAKKLAAAVENIQRAFESDYIPYSGDHIILGTSENDILDYRQDFRDLTLQGGDGNDYLRAGSGNNILIGGHGNDFLFSFLGNDILLGGAGNDYINASIGYEGSMNPYDPANPWASIDNDYIDGGEGNDVIIDMVGDNIIYGGEGNDSITAGYGNDLIYGEAGDDKINSGYGDDIVSGGDGNDYINGQVGNDFLKGGNGNDQIYGGGGNDLIHGGNGDDSVSGGDGDDRIFVGEGNDKIWADSGDDIINAGAGNDIIDGGAGNDSIYGLEGNDRIYGGDGGDKLNGGKGDDIIHGGNGNDIIFDNWGNDIMYGGEGKDIFRFDGLALSNNSSKNVLSFDKIDFGNNVIMDFQPGEDILRLDNIFAGGEAIVDLEGLLQFLSEDTQGNAVFLFDTGSVTLNQVSAADITSHTSSIAITASEGILDTLPHLVMHNSNIA